MKKPERYSQSLLRLFSDCPHAAMLYEKYRETRVESHEKMRGTATHRVLERATKEMLVISEPQIPGDVIKRIVDEVLADDDIVLPPLEADRVRVAAYHWAEATVLDLASIVAVEQLFTMDVGESTLSGKIDLGMIYSDAESGTVCELRDYKVQFNLPAEADYSVRRRDGSLAWAEFQGIFYALLIAFGEPDGGAGSLGQGIDLYRISQVFPLYLIDGDSGGFFLAERSATLKPEELHDHRAYLEGLVAKAGRAFEADKFTPVPGSHCNRCPARQECPLPATLRDMRGMIDTPSGAQAAAERHFFLTDRKHGEATVLKRELKAYADEHGAVPCGTDYAYDFKVEESRKSPDWDKLEGAIERAVLYGEPFNVEDWIEKRQSTRFERRKVET